MGNIVQFQGKLGAPTVAKSRYVAWHAESELYVASWDPVAGFLGAADLQAAKIFTGKRITEWFRAEPGYELMKVELSIVQRPRAGGPSGPAAPEGKTPA